MQEGERELRLAIEDNKRYPISAQMGDKAVGKKTQEITLLSVLVLLICS